MKPRPNALLRNSILAAAALAVGATAQAATYNWTGSTSSDFATPGNWVENSWTQWGDYRFGSAVTNGIATVNGFFGWGSISLDSGLTQDITINGSQPIVMANAWGYAGSITIASDSKNLTINNPYYSYGWTTWDVGANRTLTFNSSLSDWQSTAGLIKQGAGTAFLTGTSSYTGMTLIQGGVLNAATITNLGVAGSLGNYASDASEVGLLFRGGTLQYTGSTAQSTNRSIRLSTAGGGTIDASGSTPSATLSFTATSSANFFENGGNRTLTLTGSNTGDNTFAMAIGEAGGTTSLVKSGVGKWGISGASTYTGVTTIAGGVLNATTFANNGTASSLGVGNGDTDVNNIGLLFQGGTLQYTGSTAQSTNRSIRLSTTGGGGTIDASGSTPSATLSFTAASSTNFFEYGGNRTLTLTGSNTGDNTFAMAIGQAGGTTSLVKNGSGKWVISGANTYTGGTTITGGTLAISGSGTIGTGGLGVYTGGTLDLGTTTQAVYGINAAGAGNGAVGTISNGTINLSGFHAHLQSGTFTMNLTGGGDSRLWIGGDANATVELGGNNTSTFTDSNSTIIGHATTGAAGTVKLLSATALGPNGQNTQVHSGTLDLNGQAGITVSSIMLNGAKMANSNGTAASYAGTVTFNGTTTAEIGGAGDISLSGKLTNGGFTKTGNGTLTLSGTTNDYTGATIVSAGTLKVTGSIDSSDVTVNGGILASGSTGTVGKSVTVNSGGTFAAGNVGTVGAATVANNLNFSYGSIFDWDLTTGSGDGTYDTVSVAGALNITSGAVFNVVSSTAFTDTFWDATHTWSNIFGGKLIDNFLVSNFLYSGSATAPAAEGYFTVSGSSLTWTAVPEPTSALAGLLITAGLLRRRRAVG